MDIPQQISCSSSLQTSPEKCLCGARVRGQQDCSNSIANSNSTGRSFWNTLCHLWHCGYSCCSAKFLVINGQHKRYDISRSALKWSRILPGIQNFRKKFHLRKEYRPWTNFWKSTCVDLPHFAWRKLNTKISRKNWAEPGKFEGYSNHCVEYTAELTIVALVHASILNFLHIPVRVSLGEACI